MNVISLTPSDWTLEKHSANYDVVLCQHSQVQSRTEVHHFHVGFRLVRQRLVSRQPLWHPPFEDIDYLGLCFAFCDADPDALALSHLFHSQMNITSGYQFDGGVNHVIDKPMTYVSLQFSHDYLLQLAEQQPLPNWLKELMKDDGVIDTLPVPLRLRERAWHISQQPIATTLSQRLRLESLALEWLADALELNDERKFKQSKRQIDDAIDIIRSEYQTPLTIDELAQRVGINACYLKQQFKAQTGETINTFIRQIRLAKAQSLLSERPDLSIKMVANLCGYEASYFTAVFKKYHGVTPAQWQRR